MEGGITITVTPNNLWCKGWVPAHLSQYQSSTHWQDNNTYQSSNTYKDNYLISNYIMLVTFIIISSSDLDSIFRSCIGSGDDWMFQAYFSAGLTRTAKPKKTKYVQLLFLCTFLIIGMFISDIPEAPQITWLYCWNCWWLWSDRSEAFHEKCGQWRGVKLCLWARCPRSQTEDRTILAELHPKAPSGTEGREPAPRSDPGHAMSDR